jgi:hypothetical protein
VVTLVAMPDPVFGEGVRSSCRSRRNLAFDELIAFLRQENRPSLPERLEVVTSCR